MGFLIWIHCIYGSVFSGQTSQYFLPHEYNISIFFNIYQCVFINFLKYVLHIFMRRSQVPYTFYYYYKWYLPLHLFLAVIECNQFFLHWFILFRDLAVSHHFSADFDFYSKIVISSTNSDHVISCLILKSFISFLSFLL